MANKNETPAILPAILDELTLRPTRQGAFASSLPPLRVFVVCHLIDGTDQFEIAGVFSTREGAAAICTTENFHFVTFPLDTDCTDERTFAITTPAISMEERLVTT